MPWQQLAAEKGAVLKVAPVDNTGQIILEEYEKLFTPRTRVASMSQVSNALGTITPVADMVAIAHRHGAIAVVDGAQSVSHMPIDVQALDADFFVFSGHKMFAPTGIGAVYGRPSILESMPPWQGGGNMIQDVTFEKTTFHGPPGRFEAGTGNIADAVGLGAAIDYLMTIGMSNIAAYEHELLGYLTQGLLSVPGLRLIGTAHEKAGVALVRARRMPLRGRGQGASAGGHRGALRPPLRTADPPPLRPRSHGASVVGALQYDGRRRRSRQYAAAHPDRPRQARPVIGRASHRPPPSDQISKADFLRSRFPPAVAMYRA